MPTTNKEYACLFNVAKCLKMDGTAVVAPVYPYLFNVEMRTDDNSLQFIDNDGCTVLRICDFQLIYASTSRLRIGGFDDDLLKKGRRVYQIWELTFKPM